MLHRSDRKKNCVLAASSGGGHWIELLRLRPAFQHMRVEFVSVNSDYREQVRECGFHTVRDATSWSKFDLIICALQMFILVRRIRPDFVISTGAAPGYFAILFGKLLGARTVWVDSLANVDEISRAGRMAGRFADLWLTQWPDLQSPDGPEYAGKVI